MMTLLHVGQSNGLFTFTIVPNSYDTVCAASSDNIGEFMIEGKVGDR